MTDEEMQEAWKKTKRDWSIDIYETSVSWRSPVPASSNSDDAKMKATWIREMDETYAPKDE